jgi:hypothetical protein
MADASWKSPTSIIAIASLGLATFTFFTGRIDQQRIAQLEKSKLQLEQIRFDLDAEIKRSAEDREKQKALITEERRAELRRDLERAKKDISVWEGGLAESEPKLLLLRGELQMYQSANREIMAEATKKKIERQEHLVSQQKEELEAARRRRAELETQLH